MLSPSPPVGTYGQPPSPGGSRSSPVGSSGGGVSPANATIVLRRPPSPLSSSNLLSIGLQSPAGANSSSASPSHSRGGSGGLGFGRSSPHGASGGHTRNVSGLGVNFFTGVGALPQDEGVALPLTPRGPSNIPANDQSFDSVDDLVVGNPAYREVFRIVRLVAAQPSCDQMVLVLEKHTKHLIRGADAVRVLLVTRHGFTHPTLSQALSLDQGLASHCIHKRECVNLSSPASDARFWPDTDQMEHGAKSPAFYACVPVEGDPQPNCSGPRDVVALIQLWKDPSVAALAFSQTDMKLVLRLAEFVGNMLLRSRHADRAYALYNSSVSTQKRSSALLDVAKALSSETRLSDVVSVIVSQVPEMLVRANRQQQQGAHTPFSAIFVNPFAH